MEPAAGDRRDCGGTLLVLAALDFLPAVNALLKSGDEQAIQLYFRALGLKGVLF